MNSEKKNRKPNHLMGETSPYLKQHMYNLVDWYPWSDEAFEKARLEDKPVFLSVGYSTCHWCHVMAHESFDDPKTADFLNKHFVSIKLDREERPDLDQFYQNVIQLTGKAGGWPLSIFMTPEKKPFFAGTYFPNTKRYGMISFLDLLRRIRDIYDSERQKIVESADGIVDTIKEYSESHEVHNLESMVTASALDEVASGLENQFDLRNGGFGGAPKFPNFPTILFAIRQIAEHDKSNPQKFSHLKSLIELTLDKMSEGGIYDHIGGGFSRYSVDAHWLIPHFEKMLYDNAMALQVYSEGYKVFRKRRYKEVVRETVDWLLRVMSAGDTGFYSAMDADSEGVEGKYYAWTKNELDALLSGKDKHLFYQAYGVTSAGNFERGKTILHRFKDSSELAKDFNLTRKEVEKRLKIMRDLVFKEREKRIKPGIDTKVLTSWNSLLISGLYSAYSILKEDKVKSVAHGVVKFIRNIMYDSESQILYEVYDAESATRKNPGNLDSYAYYIQALYDDYNYTQDKESLLLVEELIDVVENQFHDEKVGGYFYSSEIKDDVPVRLKRGADMPLPSPNAVMGENLLQLHYLNAEQSHYQKAESTMSLFMRKALANPTAYGTFLTTAQWYVYGSTDIAILYSDENDKEKYEWLIKNYYIPRLHGLVSGDNVSTFAAFRDKKVVDDSSMFYFCHRFDCKAPFSVFSSLNEVLESIFIKF